MATNLGIDEVILAEAFEIGGLSTKKETVNQALKEFIQRRKQLKVIDLFGTIDFDPNYDYKAGRHRKRGRSGA